MVEENIKMHALAYEAGFDLCGVAQAATFVEHAAVTHWLAAGMHAGMGWMERSIAKSLDPKLVMPEAKSVIVCAMNYNTAYPYSTDMRKKDPTNGWIARYGWGDDYHVILEKKLKQLIAEYSKQFPGAQFRSYVDHGPVMERTFAKHAGLGWIGKNTCVINTKIGSWLFLAA